MLPDNYLLIDFSNLVYASFFRCIADARIKPDEIPLYYNDYIREFKIKLRYLTRRNPGAKLIFALDEKPLRKYEIFPQYKAKRGKLQHKDGTSFDVKGPVLQYLRDNAATVLYARDEEADDAIASFCAQNFDANVVICSTDKDLWAALCHPNVRIFNFIKGEFVTKQHLREAFCIKDKHKVITHWLKDYAHVKLHKVLWGDSGDNVPNVIPRMQKPLWASLEKSDGTWEDFLNQIDYSKLTERCKTLLKENVKKIEVNTELVHLKYNCDLVLETYEAPKREVPVVKESETPIPLDELF